MGDSVATDSTIAKTKSDSVSKTPKRILFTGNSFSFYNNGIHNHVGSLVRSANEWERGQHRFRLMTMSGAHIYENLPSIEVMLNREDENWDAVVLQGHSNEPIVSRKRDTFSASMEEAIALTKAKNVQPILFMTWEYKGDPQMGKQLASAYQDVAEKHNVLVVPVGLAFAKANIQYPSIELYVPDVLGVSKDTSNDDIQQLTYRKTLKHPSNAGTYLAACVFYAALYNKSPEGLPFTAGLAIEQAQKLQRLSWEIVQEAN
jgi:hypothetical protein